MDAGAGLAVVFDDDGKYRGNLDNRELSSVFETGIYKEVIAGDFFVCKMNAGGELGSYEPSLRVQLP